MTSTSNSPFHFATPHPILLLFFFLLACGGSQELDSPRVCEPGRSVSCACYNKTTGQQVCQPDGASWGVCNCPPFVVNGGGNPGGGNPGGGNPGGGNPGGGNPGGSSPPAPKGAGGCVEPVTDTVTRAAYRDLYEAKCSHCHGTETTYFRKKILEETAEHSDTKLIRIMQNGKDGMPAINVSNADAERIISYLLAVAKERGERVEANRCSGGGHGHGHGHGHGNDDDDD